MVVPINRDNFDVRRWDEAIKSVLMNPEAAAANAAAVHDVMASKLTWAMAAKNLLDALRTTAEEEPPDVGVVQ